MLQTVISLCFEVAQIASTVVCNSSPEGYLPSAGTDINGELNIDLSNLSYKNIFLKPSTMGFVKGVFEYFVAKKGFILKIGTLNT